MATLRSMSRLCNRIQSLSPKLNTKSFDSSSFIKSSLNPKICSSSRTVSRLPVELSALLTMLPLHSAVASSCLKSGLMIESQSWGLIPQDDPPIPEVWNAGKSVDIRYFNAFMTHLAGFFRPCGGPHE